MGSFLTLECQSVFFPFSKEDGQMVLLTPPIPAMEVEKKVPCQLGGCRVGVGVGEAGGWASGSTGNPNALTLECGSGGQGGGVAWRRLRQESNSFTRSSKVGGGAQRGRGGRGHCGRVSQ